MKAKTENNVKKTLKLKKSQKSGESLLNKAVKNVTEILKKKKIKEDEINDKKNIKTPKEQNIIKIKDLKKSIGKSKTKTKTERGVIYIGHIPHGFYEEQMQKYFSQFGKVTNVRVSRSKKTGRSKGYGFVEFLNPEVAKIAAESMNNYLMCGRLIKTEYIPPEKQHSGYFIGGTRSRMINPRQKNRLKMTKKINNSIPNKDHHIFVKKSVKNLSKLSQKLKNAGIELNIKLGDVEI